MLIRGLKPVLMAPKGDGDDGGGGDTTTIDDNDTTSGVDGDDEQYRRNRGDFVEDAPLDAEALKRVVGDDTVDAADGDDTVDGGDASGKKGSQHVPIGRFNEVNEKAKRLERENADLKKAAVPAATPAPTPPPKPEFDEDKSEREYATLLAEGEFDKAVAKRKEINTHLRESARDEAEANIRAGIEQRETVLTLTSVAAQAVKDYPYLDTEDGAETMDLIVAARDGFAAKGMSLPQALKKAVDQIAPKYAPEKPLTPGKDSTGKPGAEDTRSQQANARGADASTKQPPKLDGGAGNRVAQSKLNVEEMTDEQFDALSPAEKRQLRGDEVK